MEIKTKEIHNRLTKRSSFPGGVNLSLSLLPVSFSFLPSCSPCPGVLACNQRNHTYTAKHLPMLTKHAVSLPTAVRQAGRLESVSHPLSPSHSLSLTRPISLSLTLACYGFEILAGKRDPGSSQKMTKRKWRPQAELTRPVFLFQRLLAQHIYL
jgi:hypothetical protein